MWEWVPWLHAQKKLLGLRLLLRPQQSNAWLCFNSSSMAWLSMHPTHVLTAWFPCDGCICVQVGPEHLSEAGREDLRELCICSVDPPGCKDIDDALHVRYDNT